VIKLDTLENQVDKIFIGIGSNLGDRKSNIEKAKFYLNQSKIKITSISKYYETPSWPDPKKPNFLNVVLKVSCNFNSIDLLKICKLIEVKLGRKKDVKNAPRKCDIDIIDYNKMILDKSLILPHKSMHKRNFVLIPFFEIEKEWIHPTLNKDLKALIISLPNKDIRSIKQI
tara:strand:+ start:1515 stop:2027 length:513 start_codon:yes stop_codon:yes gene_type:complete